MSATEPGTTFDPIALLTQAWERLKDNLPAFLIAMIVFAVVVGAVELVSGVVMAILGHLPLIGRLFGLAGAAVIGLVTGPLCLGLFSMARAAVDRRAVSWQDIFSGFDRIAIAAPAGAIIGMLVALGMLILVLPGLFLALIWSTTWLCILDGKTNFWDAMEASRKIVMANLVQWALLMVVLFVCNMVGAFVCLVGLLITGPLTAIAITLAYEQQRNPGLATPVTPATAEPVDPV